MLKTPEICENSLFSKKNKKKIAKSVPIFEK
jgi:hypothetical protein